MRKLTLSLMASVWMLPAYAGGIQIEVVGHHTQGTIVIDLNEAVAPLHAGRIKTLAEEGFYDEVFFHRVIDGFMAQTGDGKYGKRDLRYAPGGQYETDPMPKPVRAGRGGSDLPDLKAEFSDIPFERGVVGMARGGREDSANSQFFIMFDRAAFLDGDYTVVGKVTSGLDVLDGIKRGDSSTFDVTGLPDHMAKVTVWSE